MSVFIAPSLVGLDNKFSRSAAGIENSGASSRTGLATQRSAMSDLDTIAGKNWQKEMLHEPARSLVLLVVR
jgi:hypothetical protein